MKSYVFGFSFLLIGSCSVDTTGLAIEDFRWSASSVDRLPRRCEHPRLGGAQCAEVT